MKTPRLRPCEAEPPTAVPRDELEGRERSFEEKFRSIEERVHEGAFLSQNLSTINYLFKILIKKNCLVGSIKLKYYHKKNKNSIIQQKNQGCITDRSRPPWDSTPSRENTFFGAVPPPSSLPATATTMSMLDLREADEAATERKARLRDELESRVHRGPKINTRKN